MYWQIRQHIIADHAGPTNAEFALYLTKTHATLVLGQTVNRIVLVQLKDFSTLLFPEILLNTTAGLVIQINVLPVQHRRIN